MKPKISIFRMLDELNSSKRTYKKSYLGTFALDPDNSTSKDGKKEYYILDITTEKQLAAFMYNYFGEGRYIVIAHPLGKGRKPWVFWKGEVNREGWIFYNQETDRTPLDMIEKQMENADTLEEKEFWEKKFNEENEELKKK